MDKLKEYKKEIAVVIAIITVVFFAVAVCKVVLSDRSSGVEKEITVDTFVSDMKDSGLTVIDSTDIKGIEGFNIEVLKVAYVDSKYRVEFYDMLTVNDAQDMFDICRIGLEGYTGEYEIEQEYIGDETVQEAIDADAENMVTVDRGDCTFYYDDSDNGFYYALAKRGDKFIYGTCSAEYCEEFMDVLKNAGIYDDSSLNDINESTESVIDTEQ